MKTIENKIIDSEKLTGKIILVQFQLIAKKPYFNETTLADFEKLIFDFNKTKEVIGISVFESEKYELFEAIDIKKYPNISIVENGRNFNERYLNVEMPTLILIDKYGKLVGYYERNEIENLKTDFNKLK